MQSYAAAIPVHLVKADEMLTRYGRWATSRGARKGAHTMDRLYIREADRRESLEAYQRRREQVPGEQLMPTPDAMRVQRALQKVPALERAVLCILYIPRWPGVDAQMRMLRITPELSQHRHINGLQEFSHWHDVLSLARSPAM